MVQSLKQSPLIGWIGFCLLALGIIAIQLSHFRHYNYRQDEAWLVMDSLIRLENENLLSIALKNLVTYPPEQILLTISVALFGHHEVPVRFSSALAMLVALAFFFQAGKTLFDQRTGFLAVFILGTISFIQFFGLEARGYSGLILGITATTYFFVQWLYRPSRKNAFAYVFWVVFGVYSHPFMVYYVFSQGLTFALFARWQWGLWRNAILLFGVSALFSAPRLIAFVIFYAQAPILSYTMQTNAESLQLLYSQMQLRPESFTPLLILGGLLFPITIGSAYSPVLRGTAWRKGIVLGVPLLTLIVAFALNTTLNNLTPRNLIIIIPPLALLAGYGLRSLPYQVAWVACAMLLVPAIQGYRPFVANGPYLEMAQTVSQGYQSKDKVIVIADRMWQHVPITYYLRYRTPHHIQNSDIFHVLPSWESFNLFAFPGLPERLIDEKDPTYHTQLADYIASEQTVWVLLGAETTFLTPQVEALKTLLQEQNYTLNQSAMWAKDNFYAPHYVLRYERLPDDTASRVLIADNTTALVQWSLNADVNVKRCQTVPLSSWWYSLSKARVNLSINALILAENGSHLSQSSQLINNSQSQLWEENTFILDERSLSIPCNAENGAYLLVIELRDNDNGDILPLTAADGTPIERTFYLTTLYVSD